MATDRTALDRRTFLGLAAASAILPRAAWAEAPDLSQLYAASANEGVDGFCALTFSADGTIGQKVALPARGHDIAIRPGTGECVVFARRPGIFAVVFDAQGRRAPQTFHARADRHFFGHGVFSTDGRLLYASENDFANSRGVISVRDVERCYKQIGEFQSGGIGPHDLAMLSDGTTLVVANGGIDTDPEAGRAPLNLDTMEPSLAYIDVRSGDLLEQHKLDASLHQLSIRHLTVAARDTVVFGCQNEGQGAPALVGWHKRGAVPKLYEAPDETYAIMNNYIGSVAADDSGEIVAATSPRGGHVLYFDVGAKRLKGAAALSGVCGVAPAHRGAGFILTSVKGALASADPLHGQNQIDARLLEALAFDNHAIAL